MRDSATIGPVPDEAPEPAPRSRVNDKGHDIEELAPAKEFPVDKPSAASPPDDTAATDDDSPGAGAAAWVEPTASPPSDDSVETEILSATVDPSEEAATRDAVAIPDTAGASETASPEATAALTPDNENDETDGDEPDTEQAATDTATPGADADMIEPAVRTNLGGGEGDRSGNISDAKYNIIDWDIGIVIDTEGTSDDIETDK